MDHYLTLKIAFIGFLWNLWQLGIIILWCLILLDFITAMDFVYCSIRTDILNKNLGFILKYS